MSDSEQLISVSNKELSLISVGIMVLNLLYHSQIEELETTDPYNQEALDACFKQLGEHIESCQPIHNLTRKLELISHLSKNLNLPVFPGLH